MSWSRGGGVENKTETWNNWNFFLGHEWLLVGAENIPPLHAAAIHNRDFFEDDSRLWGLKLRLFPLCIVLLEVVARGHPIAWPWSIDWVTQVNHLTDLVRPPWTWAIQGMKSLLNHWFNLLLSVDAVSFRALLGARFCAPTRGCSLSKTALRSLSKARRERGLRD